MEWYAHVTVAGIICRRGQFLMVEEHTPAGRVINQPAGHLEDGETLLQAVQREVLEETTCHFAPHFIVGMYLSRSADNAITYLRIGFAGDCEDADPALTLDSDIIRTIWLDEAELQRRRERHRSPLVSRCVEDFLAGRNYSLELIDHVGYPN